MSQITTITCIPGIYTNVGTGPLSLRVTSGNNAYLLLQSTQPVPNLTGEILTAETHVVNTSGSVWIRASSLSSSVIIEITVSNSAAISTPSPTANSSSTIVPILSNATVSTNQPTYANGAIASISLTGAGAIRVDSSASQQPITGVVTANLGTTGGLSLDTTSQQILAAIKNTVGISGTIWYDHTAVPVAYYVRRETLNQATGAYAVSWENVSGATATPIIANLVSVQSTNDISNQTGVYQATSAGSGFASGDLLVHCFGMNTLVTPVTLAYSFWFNSGPSVASGTIIAAPASGTYTTMSSQTTITSAALPPNAATESGHLATIDSKTPVLGQAAAAASVPVVLTSAQVTALTSPTSVSLNAGAAVIGGVTQSGTWNITVSSASAATLPTLSSGAASTSSPAYTNGTNNPLSLTLGGALRTDGSGVTQPVSIASMPSTPVTGTFWPASQPVSLLALPALGAGSAAIGTVGVTSLPSLPAGSASIGSVTVSQLPSLAAGFNTIGAISNTSFGVTGTFWQATQPVSSASATNLPTLNYAAVTTSPPTYATGTNNVLSLTTAGALRTDGSGVTQPVSGTFFQSTQPVSIAVMPTTTVTGTVASTQSGTWNIGSITTLPALVTGSASIGQVTANAGTNLNTSALALESGHLATIDAKTPALGQALIAGSSPVVLPLTQIAALTPPTSVSLNAGAAIIGSVTQSGTWNTTVSSTNAAGLPTLSSGAASTASPTYTNGTNNPLSMTLSGALRTDGSGVTQPVSISVLPSLSAGTNVIGHVIVDSQVSAVQGTPNTNVNAWPIKLTDGTVTATIATTPAAKALHVAIVDSSGTQITSFGGGGGGVTYGGYPVASAGIAGATAVAGATATGGVSTAYPVIIGGVDSANIIRRLSTDSSGNLTTPDTVMSQGYQIGQYNVKYTKYTTVASSMTATQSSPNPAIIGGVDNSDTVQYLATDSTGAAQVTSAPTTQAQQSIQDLLTQLLAATRVSNHYLYEIFVATVGSRAASEEPDALQADYTNPANSFVNLVN